MQKPLTLAGLFLFAATAAALADTVASEGTSSLLLRRNAGEINSRTFGFNPRTAEMEGPLSCE